MSNIKKFAQKLEVTSGGFEYIGGLSGDSILLQGTMVNEFTENSGTTDSSSIVYTEKALKQYVDSKIQSNDELGELSDVSLSSLSDDEILVYSNSSNEWYNTGTTDFLQNLGFLTSTEADNNYVNEDGDTMSGNLTISSGGLDVTGGITGDTLVLSSGEIVNNITSSFSSPGDNSTLPTTASVVNYVDSTVGSSATGDEGTIQFATSSGGFTGDTANLLFDTGNTTLEVNNTIKLGDTDGYLESGNNLHISPSSNIYLDTSFIFDSSTISRIDEDSISNDDNNTLATTSAITNYVDTEISNISQTIEGLDDTNVSSVSTNQVLQFNGTNWENRSDLTIEGYVNISGDLYVSGTTTTVNTEDMNVSDRLILINSGETGEGVTNNYAGIEVERGTLSNYQFLFDENDDYFKVGKVGDLQAVATRSDNPIDSGVSYWIDSDDRLYTNNNFKFDDSNNELTISNSTFGDDVLINNNLTFDGQLLTGITTTSFTGSDNELATTSAIVDYVNNETSKYISGITFNGDSGNEFLTNIDIVGGTNVDTSLSSGILTVDFVGSYYNVIEGDSGSYTATSTGETLNFVGYSGITTEVVGNEVRISSDETKSYTTDSISDGSTGQTIVIGTQGEEGSAIVNYYLTNTNGIQEGQIRVLLNGSSSGATRDFQGDEINAFDENDLLINDNGDISIKITNNSGSAVQMSYTIQNVEAH